MKICVRPGFVVPVGIFLLAPFRKTALLTLLAAVIHEFGHIAMIRAFGGRVERIELRLTGAVIVPSPRPLLGYGAEVAVSLAGVTANFLCALAAIKSGAFAFAGASLVLAFGNLLPILPLDGGRAIFFLLCRFLRPEAAFLFVNVFSAMIGISAILWTVGRRTDCSKSMLGAIVLVSGIVIIRAIVNLFAKIRYFYK